MPSDYFILHRIGMIYLYVPALGNLEKALDYFARAAKYAFVESHPDAARLSNVLNKSVTKRFADQAEASATDLKAHAAESYFQAATVLYALGRFDEAVKMAEKAVTCQPDEAKYRFFLSKYLIRSVNPDSAVAQLKKAIELFPEMTLAALGDFDLNRSQPILDLLNTINDNIDAQLKSGMHDLMKWPRRALNYQNVQQLITNVQVVLEKGNYPEKQLLADKVKEYVEALPIGVNVKQISQTTPAGDSDKFVRWKVEDFDEGFADAAVGEDGTVFVVGLESNKLYAFSGQTGEKRWEIATAGGVCSAPAIGWGTTVYLAG